MQNTIFVRCKYARMLFCRSSGSKYAHSSTINRKLNTHLQIIPHRASWETTTLTDFEIEIKLQSTILEQRRNSYFIKTHPIRYALNTSANDYWMNVCLFSIFAICFCYFFTSQRKLLSYAVAFIQRTLHIKQHRLNQINCKSLLFHWSCSWNYPIFDDVVGDELQQLRIYESRLWAAASSRI